ncbi:MAG: proton-conducting transporter membrane subunit [Anaerolineae bacterium]
MSLITLLVTLVVVASLVHATRFWPRVASVLILLGGGLLVWGAWNASLNSLDVVGLTLVLDPFSRDFLTVAFALTMILALASTLVRDRSGLAFLFWTWPAWVVALSVNDLVVSVFAWALGMVAAVLAMKPRKYQRASGAAYFLVLVVVAAASLLLANRFIVLYPLTPERTVLVQFAVLFLTWGMGLYLSVFPFHLWVAPMSDDAPLPVLAALLGLGQPIGLLLLMSLFSQYPWILDRSNLLQLLSLGGAAAVITGGVMAAVERRAGRLLGYAGIFSLGFALVSLSHLTRESLAYGGLEILTRGFALAAMACAITVAEAVHSRWVQRLALVVFILSALSLVGLRLGVSFASRWNVMVEWAGTDMRLLAVVLVAHTGLVVGIVRFARRWLESQEAVAGPALAVAGVELAEPAVGITQAKGVAAVVESHSSAGESNAPVGDTARTSEASLESGSESAPPENREPAGAAISEDYVFEEHVRELARTLVARYGSRLTGLVRALPRQTRSTLFQLWQNWRVGAGMALLVVVVALLLLTSLEPGLWFNRILDSLGSLPFAQ